MKSTAPKRNSNSRTTSNVIGIGGPYSDASNRLDHIAIAAYYKAEGRGFSPGLELEDWLEAEAEFNRREGQ